jgi:hypothetical protein
MRYLLGLLGLLVGGILLWNYLDDSGYIHHDEMITVYRVRTGSLASTRRAPLSTGLLKQGGRISSATAG